MIKYKPLPQTIDFAPYDNGVAIINSGFAGKKCSTINNWKP